MNKTIINCLIGVIIFLLSGTIMFYEQQPLTNDQVVNMELAFDDVSLRESYSTLSSEIVQTSFKTHARWDFILMIGYVMLIYFFIEFVLSKNFYFFIGQFLQKTILIAGLLDAIEDFLMYQRIVLQNQKIHAFHWSYLSSIKFGIIGVCILYLLSFIFSYIFTKNKNNYNGNI